jgi:hypothetical protein
MMSSFFLADGSKLEYNVSYQTVTSWGYNKPDRAWSFTDEAGHEHHWADNGIPSCIQVWQLGYCGRCEDIHVPGDILDYYQCAQCGEVINPGYVWVTPEPTVAVTSQEIVHSGLVELTADGTPGNLWLDPEYVSVQYSSLTGKGVAEFRRYLSPDEAEALIERVGVKQPPRRGPGIMWVVGQGGGGSDQSIPECPGCGAYGGGGHGGGCPER